MSGHRYTVKPSQSIGAVMGRCPVLGGLNNQEHSTMSGSYKLCIGMAVEHSRYGDGEIRDELDDEFIVSFPTGQQIVSKKDLDIDWEFYRDADKIEQ